MVRKKKSSYEDIQEAIRQLPMPEIEIWENKYPDRDYTVYLDTDECTCICPKTGLPDFIRLKIAYIPTKTCIELKSFKMYLIAYRQVGIFHEHIVNKIMDDIVRACRPKWIRVEGIVTPQGGYSDNSYQ